MKIADFLSKDSIILDNKTTTKKQLLVVLSDLAQKTTKLDSRVVFDALIERERLGTTGVGKGVALPHIRLTGIDKIYCAFIKVKPLDFEAIDNRLVDLVFFLLVPEEAGADHLKALAKLSRLLRNETVAEALRKTDKTEELYKIITGNDTDA